MVKLLLLATTPLLLSAQIASDSQSKEESKEYEGPSVLSRGGPASSLNDVPNISFRPYLGLTATYETGFTGVVRNSAGQVQNIDSYGVQANGGVYGLHHFKRGILGIDYDAHVQHYFHNSFGDGIDQMLTLSFTHHLSKRVALKLSEVAGTYTRNYAYTSGSGLIDPQSLIVPTADLFDNRVYFGETVGALVYRVSPRLSINLEGAGYLVRRRSSSLYGVTGYAANVDAAYRLSRFLTLSPTYQFQHFEFTRAFGASDVHMAGAALAARLNRSLEMAVEAGGARVETLYQATVAIDPVIAAITGQSQGIQATYSVRYVPTGRFRLTKQMQKATATVGYSQGVTPGNGVYLTSREESATGSLSLKGTRHWYFTASGGYYRLSALAQSLGVYEGSGGGIGITRDIARNVQWSFRVDARHYTTNHQDFHRTDLNASMGFYWSPGEVPLTLW
jgi:hypothetical protein